MYSLDRAVQYDSWLWVGLPSFMMQENPYASPNADTAAEIDHAERMVPFFNTLKMGKLA